ncbi:hypothetical protein NIES2104_56620 [Leptolyngbya sp. NIES-2104]|nr:hypothetical protein NIES2104_56620 [Leptolyngbya sp. NIES-2104]
MLDEVCQQISQDNAAKMFGWKVRTLQNFVLKQHQEPPEWQWVKGICYFQLSNYGAMTYDRCILTLWQVAKSQNDVSIYLNAISRFQSVVKP